MLVRASLTRLDPIETLEVLWNPRAYRLHRRNRFAAPALPGRGTSPLLGAAGGEERFGARLLLDGTEREGPARDVRAWGAHLERWAEVEEGTGLPPEILFHWGAFRFRGRLEDLVLECVAFDPDGTPVRAWIDLVLRR